MKAISLYGSNKPVVHLWKPYIGEFWERKCNGRDLHKSNLKEVQSESEGTPCTSCFPEKERDCACPGGKCQPEKNEGCYCWRSGELIPEGYFSESEGAE